MFVIFPISYFLCFIVNFNGSIDTILQVVGSFVEFVYRCPKIGAMFSSMVTKLEQRIGDEKNLSLLHREQHLESIVNIAEVRRMWPSIDANKALLVFLFKCQKCVVIIELWGWGVQNYVLKLGNTLVWTWKTQRNYSDCHMRCVVPNLVSSDNLL